MKIMQGAFLFACSNISRIRLAPTPTNISTKSDPAIEKNGRSASPDTALAIKVFPVPGGPINNTPLGILPPKLVNFVGFLRKSTISINSSFASSIPATSAKVTLFCPFINKRAGDFPKDMAEPFIPRTCLEKTK